MITGFCEATTQQKISNPQDYIDGLQKMHRICILDTIGRMWIRCRSFRKDASSNIRIVESWLSTDLPVFARLGAKNQFVSITINQGCC